MQPSFPRLQGMNALYELDYEPDDLKVKISELLVATSDESDTAIDACVLEVLRLLRDRLQMDVVFVSEFFGDHLRIQHVATTPGGHVIAQGDCHPLEETWCQRVVDGRLPQYIANAAAHPASAPLAAQLPFPMGTFISTPVVLKCGEVYGTLCAFSFLPQEQSSFADLKKLQFTAQLAAQKIDQRRLQDHVLPPELVLELTPLQRQRMH
jgi:GAF domain-containing protein